MARGNASSLHPTRTYGTRRLRSTPAGAVLLLHLVLPLFAVAAGLATLGPGAISWSHAIAAGLVATLAFSLFEMALRSAAVARLDVLELLPAAIAAFDRSPSRTTIVALHLGAGALFAVAWAYVVALGALPAHAGSGAAWGVVLWVLATLLTALAGQAERIDRDDPASVPAPSAAALVSSLFGHVLYGTVLGVFYAAGYPGAI